MLLPFAIALWIVAPVVLGGLTHVAVIKLGLLKTLAAMPLDGGATFQGHRLFGDNKTLRGVVVMMVAMPCWVWVQIRYLSPLAWADGLPPPFEAAHPLIWGALVGAGYILGELPNSFIKRRRGIASGAAAPGIARAVFWTIDQVDCVAGFLVVSYPVWKPSGAVVLALFVVSLLVHPVIALVMVCLGLKSRVG